MKLYAPKYYNNFACIAGACRHSCCIGWEIDIDGATMQKYDGLGEGYGQMIGESIEREETPHFRLLSGERCPHLDSCGLCRIILELGEGYLCDICREHPRFYNFFSQGCEVGLGMACEEAARLILSSDNYKNIEPIGETGGEPFESAEIDTISLRERIYGIISDRSLPYADRLCEIYEELGVCPAERSDDEWRELIVSLEYLDGAHCELFLRYSSDAATEGEHEIFLERALAYFVFRHCTETEDEAEYRAALGFCLFCERLLSSVARDGGDIFELARIVSEELEYSEDNTEAIKNFFC